MLSCQLYSLSMFRLITSLVLASWLQKHLNRSFAAACFCTHVITKREPRI